MMSVCVCVCVYDYICNFTAYSTAHCKFRRIETKTDQIRLLQVLPLMYGRYQIQQSQVKI